jgi:hypothetical protein
MNYELNPWEIVTEGKFKRKNYFRLNETTEPLKRKLGTIIKDQIMMVPG